MSMSRLLFSCIRNGSAKSLSGLKRFCPNRGFHSTSSACSARHSKNPLMASQVSTSYSWRHFLIPTAVLGGVGGLAFYIRFNDERRSIAKGEEVKFVRSSIEGPIIGGPFCLIDTGGHVVNERDFMGHWVLLYFGYTSSPDIGPAEVQKMAQTVHILEAKQNLKVLPVFVTIDPQRDTPSQLRAYLKEFSPKIVGLTGPVTSVRQMAQEYRVFFRKVDEEGDDYLVESSHNMYLLNPNMQVMKNFGVEYGAEELSEAIAKELKKPTT